MKKNTMFQHSDGGASKEGFTFEKNDCTVRCLATVTEMNYKDAHLLLKSLGRKDMKSFSFSDLISYGVKGFTITREYNHIDSLSKNLTVNQMLKSKKLKDGKYAVNVSGHVFTVIDGVIIDGFESGKKCKRVKNIWKFTKNLV